MNARLPPTETVSALARAFADRAPQHDRPGTVAHESVAALREAGILGLDVPRTLGGGGAGL